MPIIFTEGSRRRNKTNFSCVPLSNLNTQAHNNENYSYEAKYNRNQKINKLTIFLLQKKSPHLSVGFSYKKCGGEIGI